VSSLNHKKLLRLFRQFRAYVCLSLFPVAIAFGANEQETRWLCQLEVLGLGFDFDGIPVQTGPKESSMLITINTLANTTSSYRGSFSNGQMACSVVSDSGVKCSSAEISLYLNLETKVGSFTQQLEASPTFSESINISPLNCTAL